jgi:hypothetical protein
MVTVYQDGTQLGQFTAASAIGDPSNYIWRVVNLQINLNGTVVLKLVQTFVSGDEYTTF